MGLSKAHKAKVSRAQRSRWRRVKRGTNNHSSFLIPLLQEDVEYLRSIPGYDWRKRVRNIVHRARDNDNKIKECRDYWVEQCATYVELASMNKHIDFERIVAALRSFKDKPTKGAMG